MYLQKSLVNLKKWWNILEEPCKKKHELCCIFQTFWKWCRSCGINSTTRAIKASILCPWISNPPPEFGVLILISKLGSPIFGPLIYKAGVQIRGPWISNPAPIFGPYIFYPPLILGAFISISVFGIPILCPWISNPASIFGAFIYNPASILGPWMPIPPQIYWVLISIPILSNQIFCPWISKAGAPIFGPWISNPAPIFGVYISNPA